MKPTSVSGLAAHLVKRKLGERLIVALAGPPASGKSKTAEDLRVAVADLGRSAAVFPMDGFHYDDAVLEARGHRPRKGAPFTFDTDGFGALLARLARNEGPEIAVPVFDRDLEISRAAARIIPHDIEVLIVEGNYLLLGETDWAKWHDFYDVTVMVVAAPTTLRDRLIARWQGQGLADTEIAAKVEDNDLPNGELVLAESVAADFVISTD